MNTTKKTKKQAEQMTTSSVPKLSFTRINKDGESVAFPRCYRNGIPQMSFEDALKVLAPVAQGIERAVPNRKAGGSNPSGRAKVNPIANRTHDQEEK